VLSVVVNDKPEVIVQNRLEVVGGRGVVVPGCEPTSAVTSTTLMREQRGICKNTMVDVAAALLAIPGSTLEFGLNFGGVRQTWFVLPPSPFACCQPYAEDWYKILRELPPLPDQVEDRFDNCNTLGMGFCPSGDFEMGIPEPQPGSLPVAPSFGGSSAGSLYGGDGPPMPDTYVSEGTDIIAQFYASKPAPEGQPQPPGPLPPPLAGQPPGVPLPPPGYVPGFGQQRPVPPPEQPPIVPPPVPTLAPPQQILPREVVPQPLPPAPPAPPAPPTAAPKWIKPDLNSETKDIERTARELAISPSDLTAALASGKLTKLTDKVWQQLPNSNSYGIGRRDAEEHAASHKKGLRRIMYGLQHGGTLPAPIIVKRRTGPYLVAGNTRLMAAQVLKLTPLVWYADISSLT